MISNYYTLAHIASLLDSRLVNHPIRSIFTQESGQMVIDLGPGNSVIVSCQPGLNALFLHHRFSRARKNTVDLFPSCQERLIRSIAIHPSDRVVIFLLDSGERIEASFFGAAANVTLLGPDNNVIASFKRRKEPASVTASSFPIANDPDTTVSAYLKRDHPRLGPQLVREVITRAHVPGLARWGTLSEDEKGSIHSALAEIQNDLLNIRPRIYFADDGIPEFSIIPLRQYENFREERFDDIHDAIRTCIGKKHSSRTRESEQDLLEKRLRTMMEKSERTADAMEEDRDTSARPTEYERFGKLLLGNLTAVKPGMESITLPAEGIPVTITLQRDLTPAANAQRYFEKAKRSRTARKQTDERLSSIRDRIGVLRSLLDELSAQPDIKAFIERRSADLQALGLSEKQKASADLPFRVYHVEGGFEVWAGKNSKSNDELTMKHARPNDLWFHARGAGGSHVILRVNTAKGEPGKRARMQAASVAAFFSKMKGAKMVPVAMTQRKYVRKPKGAPPGTVVIEREEVIITEPRLPDEKKES